jgi:hypothetical protein
MSGNLRGWIEYVRDGTRSLGFDEAYNNTMYDAIRIMHEVLKDFTEG